MMLVYIDPVEAHLLGIQVLVNVPVVKLGTQVRVVYPVTKGQVLDGKACGPEVARIRILIGTFSNMRNMHFSLLCYLTSATPDAL
jgi:hypothetical protein